MTVKVTRDAAPAAAEAAADSRVRTFVVSNEAVDRYNTTIATKGWRFDNYRRNPVVMLGHGGELPIGKASVSQRDNQTFAEIEIFDSSKHPDGDRVLRQLDAGVMAASVGFMPLAFDYNVDRETGDERDWWTPPLDYTATELLEISIVAVPGNPTTVPVGRSVGLPATPANDDAAFVLEVARRSLGQPSRGVSPKKIQEARAATLAAREAAKAPPAPPEPTLTIEQIRDAVRSGTSEAVELELRAQAARRSGKLSAGDHHK